MKKAVWQHGMLQYVVKSELLVIKTIYRSKPKKKNLRPWGGGQIAGTLRRYKVVMPPGTEEVYNNTILSTQCTSQYKHKG